MPNLRSDLLFGKAVIVHQGGTGPAQATHAGSITAGAAARWVLSGAGHGTGLGRQAAGVTTSRR